uniref:usherin isoform X3 n=1 Tax=Oncorhynchus gorbuscha TaxID=8017 RepID=UPI001EAEC03B|nr:usherin isoform X3 [Oncorhynchus gorbuscha]
MHLMERGCLCPRHTPQHGHQHWELWFIVLMTGVALVVLAIVLGIILHKALKRTPFTRERPPLVALPMQKRSPMAVYPPSDSYLVRRPNWFDTVPNTTSSSNSVTLKGFTMHLEGVEDSKFWAGGDAPPEGELGILNVSSLHVSAIHGSAHSQNSLRRSVSQMMDRKSLTGEEEVWDSHIQGHDSGMFMEDEEFVDTIKGFSTVRKEHTMFTDTNL